MFTHTLLNKYECKHEVLRYCQQSMTCIYQHIVYFLIRIPYWIQIRCVKVLSTKYDTHAWVHRILLYTHASLNKYEHFCKCEYCCIRISNRIDMNIHMKCWCIVHKVWRAYMITSNTGWRRSIGRLIFIGHFHKRAP